MIERFTLGIRCGALQDWLKSKECLRRASLMPVAPLPEPKKHKFKYRLPKLKSYKGGDIPEYFWKLWQKRSLKSAVFGNASWIVPSRLLGAAIKRGAPVDSKLVRVCGVLENGANIPENPKTILKNPKKS